MLITTMRSINAILLDGVQSDELPEDLLLRSLWEAELIP